MNELSTTCLKASKCCRKPHRGAALGAVHGGGGAAAAAAGPQPAERGEQPAAPPPRQARGHGPQPQPAADRVSHLTRTQFLPR